MVAIGCTSWQLDGLTVSSPTFFALFITFYHSSMLIFSVMYFSSSSPEIEASAPFSRHHLWEYSLWHHQPKETRRSELSLNF
jgi:hypothetical protein